jgi:hypothetical protein
VNEGLVRFLMFCSPYLLLQEMNDIEASLGAEGGRFVGLLCVFTSVPLELLGDGWPDCSYPSYWMV